MSNAAIRRDRQESRRVATPLLRAWVMKAAFQRKQYLMPPFSSVMMQTVQAFDWSWFSGKWHNAHFPTREEMSLMARAQVDEGATGIGFFSISCMMDGLKGEAFASALEDVKAVAAEIRDRSTLNP